MNKKGLFCFLIVLWFASMQAGFFSSDLRSRGNIARAEALGFEIEKLSLERTVLEENIDFLVKETMSEEIQLGNRNSEKIKNSVNGKISAFLEKAKKTAEEKIVFFEKEQELGENGLGQFLNENSNVLLISYKNFVLAEYNFTGGLMKNNFLKAEIETANAKKTFRIPIGYSQKALVAK